MASTFSRTGIKNFVYTFLLAFLAFLGAAIQSNAQNYYYCKFQSGGDAGKVYESLVTVFDDTSIHIARIQPFLTDQPDKPRFDGSFLDSASGETDPDKSILYPIEVVEITGQSSQAPPLPRFEFTYNPNGQSTLYNLTGVYLSEGDKWVPAKILETKGYSLIDIDLTLVRTFYSSGSRYYRSLIETMSEASVGTRNLSATELKTRIWMVIVADTLDPSAGKGCKQDMMNMTEMFTNIAADMQLPKPYIRYIMGANFNKKALMDTLIRFLKPKPDDIVIFYYSGHGYRLPNDKNDYPRMVLSNNYTEKTLYNVSLPIADVRKVLETKRERARLTFIINDCCNINIPLPRQYGLLPLLGTRSLGSYVASDNFRKLFLEPKGIIQIGSSSKGEYSIGNPSIGGYYTSEFLTNLNQSLSKFRKEVSWNDICQKSSAAATKRAYTRSRCKDSSGTRKVPCRQTPTYSLNISFSN